MTASLLCPLTHSSVPCILYPGSYNQKLDYMNVVSNAVQVAWCRCYCFTPEGTSYLTLNKVRVIHGFRGQLDPFIILIKFHPQTLATIMIIYCTPILGGVLYVIFLHQQLVYPDIQVIWERQTGCVILCLPNFIIYSLGPSTQLVGPQSPVQGLNPGSLQ